LEGARAAEQQAEFQAGVEEQEWEAVSAKVEYQGGAESTVGLPLGQSFFQGKAKNREQREKEWEIGQAVLSLNAGNERESKPRSRFPKRLRRESK
jgi:hypothetical protein